MSEDKGIDPHHAQEAAFISDFIIQHFKKNNVNAFISILAVAISAARVLHATELLTDAEAGRAARDLLSGAIDATLKDLKFGLAIERQSSTLQ